MRRDYRTVLRAKGIKPIPSALRTIKKPGDVEIGWCPKARDHVATRVEGETQ